MPVEPRAYAACGVVPWLRRMRAAVAVALLFTAFAVAAADLQIVSLSQTKPGIVVATVRTSDRQPPATAFHLSFPSVASGLQDFVAKEVTPADTSADLATTVVICVDRSGSMQRVVPSVKAALHDAFSTPRPDLRAELLMFGTTVSRQLLPLSTSQQDMLRALRGIRAESGPDGKTRLYDSIVEAINRLRNDPAVRAARLLIISDGKDEGSSISLDNLAKIARQRGFRIDSIGYGKLAPQWSHSLETLSNATGGTYVLATADAALSDAIRNDLGTTPLPAFEVRFEYATSGTETAPGSAMLRYVAAGASAVTAPIAVPLALPSASGTSAGSSSADSAMPTPSEALAAPSHQQTWFDAFIGWLSRADHRIGIATGGLIAAAVSLLTGWWWLLVFRRRATVRIAVQGKPDTPGPRPMGSPTQIGSSFPPPERGRPAALLIGQSASWRGRHYPIEHATVRIGSDEKCDLALTGDDFVSHQHATIRYESGSLYVSDLSSTNGTFVNGTRMTNTSRVLSAGDEIRFGHTSFELRGGGEHSPILPRDGNRHSVP